MNKAQEVFGKFLARAQRNWAATKELPVNWKEFDRLSRKSRKGFGVVGENELLKLTDRIANGLKIPAAAAVTTAAAGVTGKKLLED
jgi:hypothetical protein